MRVTRKDLETIVFGCGTSGRSNLPLTHVRVEPNRLVACNGSVIIVRALQGSDDFKPFSISIDDVRAAIKANAGLWRPKDDTVEFSPGDEFMAKIGVKSVAKQDGSYPEWKRVMIKRDAPNGFTALFAPEQMMRVLKGMKDIEFVEFTVWDKRSASRVDGETIDGRKVVAMIMPAITHNAGRK